MSIKNWMSGFRSGKSFFTELTQRILGSKDSRENNTINEILLYGAENEEHMQEIGLNNLFCIYYMILHANKYVDVCVPRFTSEILTKCLVNVHQKGKVKVRFVVHNSEDVGNLNFLVQNGIEVKIIKPSVLLEHEFLLIDASDKFKDAVAIIGSLDYDTSNVNCNRDATVLTSDTAVVKPLKREFDRIWNFVTDIRHPKNDDDFVLFEAPADKK